MTESITRLHVIDTTAMRVERCLYALTQCIGDASIAADTRRALASAHAILHASRDAETVKRMEHEKGLMPEGTSK